MKILVTGASGFIGQRVVELALEQAIEVRGQSRSQEGRSDSRRLGYEHVVKVISPDTKWEDALSEVDCIVHCAAKVHQMKHEKSAKQSYETVNTTGTLELARQAAKQGVKRFVFLSSIKVNGEYTTSDQMFTHASKPNPDGAYAASKLKAEQGLMRIASETSLEVVIVRAPLVYGPGVSGNFLSLMRMVKRRVPLPLGRINNHRSMVYLDNLVDLLLQCCQNDAAAGQVFLVSDGQDVSTTRLLSEIAVAMNKVSLNLPIPSLFLLLLGTMVGKRPFVSRLCGNLQVDISHTRQILNWAPRDDFKYGVKKTVEAYMSSFADSKIEQK